jgi:hypothetical protein
MPPVLHSPSSFRPGSTHPEEGLAGASSLDARPTCSRSLLWPAEPQRDSPATEPGGPRSWRRGSASVVPVAGGDEKRWQRRSSAPELFGRREEWGRQKLAAAQDWRLEPLMTSGPVVVFPRCCCRRPPGPRPRATPSATSATSCCRRQVRVATGSLPVSLLPLLHVAS